MVGLIMENDIDFSDEEIEDEDIIEEIKEIEHDINDDFKFHSLEFND
jgi:hypothetical protein